MYRWEMKHTTGVLWTLQHRVLGQHWELPQANRAPPKPSDWHISRAEETLSHFLLFIRCYFCYLKPSLYFQRKGTSPSPLLGLKQDSFWNSVLIPSQTLRLNIYFYKISVASVLWLVLRYIRVTSLIFPQLTTGLEYFPKYLTNSFPG